jgi:hypothetical protein
MNRLITDLIEALTTARALFQTVESAPVSRLARRRPTSECSPTETKFWRGGRAASLAKLSMKTLVLAVSLGTLLGAANFVQPAKAQDPDAARERALQDCNRMDMAFRHEEYEFGKTGGNKYVYRACMANHGQTE